MQPGSPSCHIGIDLMGSEIPVRELLDEIAQFTSHLPANVCLTLFGIRSVLEAFPSPHPRCFLHVCEEVIAMEDDPLSAIRLKKNSSICLGIQMLREHHLQAFVSAGNTGALMACAKLQLPMLPGISRPALITLLPTRAEEVAVVDVGANTSYKAEHLIQFAKMGIAYQKNRGVPLPRVGLLNIGAEAKKGTPEHRLAYLGLEDLNRSQEAIFVGNIEARDVFQGQIDVLVTDGFTGNVFLKTAEGIACVIREQIEEIAKQEDSPHLKGLLCQMHHHLHYAEYPGALLCGTEGIVLKCHSTATPQSMIYSTTSAIRLVQHGFLQKLKAQLSPK